MRINGTVGRGCYGMAGIEVPIDPPSADARKVAALLADQSDFLGRGVRTGRPTPARRRARSKPAPAAPVAVAAVAPAPAPTPAPEPEPELVDVIEEMAPAGPGPCEAPGCRTLVTAEYVRRTGERIHPPCKARLARLAQTSSASSTSRDLVGAGAGGRS